MFFIFYRAFQLLLLSLNHVFTIKNSLGATVSLFWIFLDFPTTFGFGGTHFGPVFWFSPVSLEHIYNGHRKIQCPA